MKMKFDHRFVAAFNTFMEGLREIVRTETKTDHEVSYEEGYKYIRIVLSSVGPNPSKTAWGFIDKRSGDIFRSASWKAPCLNHVRGNIYDESNGLKHCLWTGPAYIWEINEKKGDEADQQPTPEAEVA